MGVVAIVGMLRVAYLHAALASHPPDIESLMIMQVGNLLPWRWLGGRHQLRKLRLMEGRVLPLAIWVTLGGCWWRIGARISSLMSFRAIRMRDSSRGDATGRPWRKH